MAHAQFYTSETMNDPISVTIEQLSVIYTGYMHYDFEPEYEIVLHTHEYCEIMYVFSGNGNINIDGVNYPLKSGDLIIINPGIPHQETSTSDSKMHMAFFAVENFSVDGLPKNDLITPQMPPVISGMDYRYKIESYFTDLISESADSIMLSSAMSKTLAVALMILILRLYHSRGTRNSDMKEECRRIKDYIDKNYTSPITLDSLSEQIYISKYYLSHIFKSQTGTSPIKYLLNKRISKAAQLLTDTDLRIRDIALRVGYDDPVYFSQMFKKVMNESPAAYRSNHKK